MTELAHRDQDSSGTTDRSAVEQLPDDTLPLGVDGEDAAHHYSRIAQTVVVEAPSGRVERRVDLEDRSLAAWIGFVDETREWRTLNYAGSFADILSEAIAGGA